MSSRYRTVDVDGLAVFYREAGDPAKPALLLLHGFPSSSHMFRGLIPLLERDFHLVAPDLPGFGRSAMPPRDTFDYTFDSLARVVDRFTEVIGLARFSLYVFDYGAPVGFRLAMWHPERILGIVTQNGNAYAEGLSDAFAPLRAYWDAPGDQAKRDALHSLLTPQTTLFQYLHGVADPERVAPDGPALDDAYLARPGNDEIQLDLFRDYGSNVALYGAVQAYLRAHQPPVLALWGRNDPFFLPAGAEAFARDARDCEVVLLDTGHFALETHAPQIADSIRSFLAERGAAS